MEYRRNSFSANCGFGEGGFHRKLSQSLVLNVGRVRIEQRDRIPLPKLGVDGVGEHHQNEDAKEHAHRDRQRQIQRLGEIGLNLGEGSVVGRRVQLE